MIKFKFFFLHKPSKDMTFIFTAGYRWK